MTRILGIDPGSQRTGVGIIEKMNAEPAARKILQRLDGKARPQVRPADADIDHVGDVGSFQFTDQRAHPHLCFQRLRPCCHGNRAFADVTAQGRVQRRAAFGAVDRLAVERGAQRRHDARSPGQIEQGAQSLAVVTLTGEVRVQRADPKCEISTAPGIAGDQIAHLCVDHPCCVPAQHLPLRIDMHGQSGVKVGGV